MKKKRKRLWLRFLIDQRHIILILLGLFGLIFIPIQLYTYVSMNNNFTFQIFIAQMVWILGASLLAGYILHAKRYRRKEVTEKH